MWKLKRGSNYIILGYADMVKLKEKIFKKLAYNIRLYNIGFVKIINNWIYYSFNNFIKINPVISIKFYIFFELI